MLLQKLMSKYFYKKRRNTKRFLRIFGGIISLTGFIALIYFFFPLISWQIFYPDTFASESKMEVPVPKYLVGDNNLKSVLSERINFFTTNYSDARNWYPQIQGDIGKSKKIESYFLSIPKLKIENVTVSTVDYELANHLVQYFGTSLPGENGTAVIFGHSTLPQLFDPKNYKTIFATLHTIKIGDEIDANVLGVTYKYKVFSITITDPNDTGMLSQNYDDSYITLVTCTPPGTTWKRLIVRAKLDK